MERLRRSLEQIRRQDARDEGAGAEARQSAHRNARDACRVIDQ